MLVVWLLAVLLVCSPSPSLTPPLSPPAWGASRAPDVGTEASGSGLFPPASSGEKGPGGRGVGSTVLCVSVGKIQKLSLEALEEQRYAIGMRPGLKHMLMKD